MIILQKPHYQKKNDVRNYALIISSMIGCSLLFTSKFNCHYDSGNGSTTGI